jgi:hypothetical protein
MGSSDRVPGLCSRTLQIYRIAVILSILGAESRRTIAGPSCAAGKGRALSHDRMKISDEVGQVSGEAFSGEK